MPWFDPFKHMQIVTRARMSRADVKRYAREHGMTYEHAVEALAKSKGRGPLPAEWRAKIAAGVKRRVDAKRAEAAEAAEAVKRRRLAQPPAPVYDDADPEDQP